MAWTTVRKSRNDPTAYVGSGLVGLLFADQAGFTKADQMTLDDFLTATSERIPTVDEMVGLCDTLNIGFRIVDGRPALRAKPGENEAEAVALAKLFRREPFRSMVIAAKLNGESVLPPSNVISDDEAEPVSVPAGAVIVRADASGYTNAAMRGPVYMWTWLGADRWYYAEYHKMPTGD